MRCLKIRNKENNKEIFSLMENDEIEISDIIKENETKKVYIAFKSKTHRNNIIFRLGWDVNSVFEERPCSFIEYGRDNKYCLSLTIKLKYIDVNIES